MAVCLNDSCAEKALPLGHFCKKHSEQFLEELNSAEVRSLSPSNKILQDDFVVELADLLVSKTPYFRHIPGGVAIFNIKNNTWERLGATDKNSEGYKIIKLFLPPSFAKKVKQSYLGHFQRAIVQETMLKHIEEPDDYIHYFNNGYFSWYDKKFHKFGENRLKVSFFRHNVDFDPDFKNAELSAEIPHNRKLEMAMTILPSDKKLNKVFVTTGVPNSGKTFVNKLISRALGESSSLKLPILRKMNYFQLSSVEGKSYIYSDDDGAEERHHQQTDLESVQFLKEVATRAPISVERKGSGTVYNISPNSYGVFAVMGNNQPRFGLDVDGALLRKRFVMTFMDKAIPYKDRSDNFERKFLQKDILKYMFRLGVDFLNGDLILDEQEMIKGEVAYYKQFRYFSLCFEEEKILSFSSYGSMVESEGGKLLNSEDMSYVEKCQKIIKSRGYFDHIENSEEENDEVAKVKQVLGIE